MRQAGAYRRNVKSRRNMRTDQVAGMEEITDAYKIMDGKHKGTIWNA
jgi:hypothetical protein